ncbi:ubiquinol-cytochrome C reductase hinge domain-containing protein [Phlyctochytrium arcticum]|nr:ubiquinol-cytochrome C reductase hinge domain-containing protein [Phlyctochytrium arcticum]
MSDDWNPSEDPKPEIEAKCAEGHHCHSFKARLDRCSEKIEAGNGAEEETCVEEFFDLMECVNHCAADKLFSKLK